jgi:hypothetical protein
MAGGRDVQVPEPAPEGDVLGRGDGLVAEEEHQELEEQIVDLLDLGVRGIAQVDARHLGAEVPRQWTDRQGHGASSPVLRPTPLVL